METLERVNLEYNMGWKYSDDKDWPKHIKIKVDEQELVITRKELNGLQEIINRVFR